MHRFPVADNSPLANRPAVNADSPGSGTDFGALALGGATSATFVALATSARVSRPRDERDASRPHGKRRRWPRRRRGLATPDGQMIGRDRAATPAS
jgi:hypothetical protein